MLDSGIDRLICRTNAQRVAVNVSMRKIKSFPESSLQVGEEIICLKNDYAKDICNGEVFKVLEVTSQEVNTTSVTLQSVDTGKTVHGELWNAQFHQEKRLEDDNIDPKYILADFAYGITGHKAQGSSWRHVGVVSRGFAGQEREWSYTGVTRAEEELTIF
jgi:exodeoxyribonuclease-5